MGRIGFWEIVLVVSVIVLLFGAKKIPEIAQGLGKAMKEFKKAGREMEEEANKTTDTDDNKTAS